MSEAKFTPGPWMIHRLRYERPGYSIVPAGQEERPLGCSFVDEDKNKNYYANEIVRVCRCFDFVTAEETRSNAQLIAAAPELYEALCGAQEELRLLRMKDTATVYDPSLNARISMALAKARGETR